MGKIHILAPFPGSQVKLLGRLDRFSTGKVKLFIFCAIQGLSGTCFTPCFPEDLYFLRLPLEFSFTPSLMQKTKQIHAKPLQLETLVFMYLKFVLINK